MRKLAPPRSACLSTPFLALACLGAASLAACGGGGGGGSASSPPPPPPPPSGPTYTAGVFAPASQFVDRCANPRSGVDIEGNRFPDRQGTLRDELFWLRSWTNETYLWNDEVPDLNPFNYNDRIVYFDLLKTSETTASGAPKDQFHFSQPTSEFLEQRNSTPQPAYGIRFRVGSSTVPRDYRVLYTEPASPAETAGFRRGDRIFRIDGVDFVNATSQSDLDTLNNGLFASTSGETHTFVVGNPDGTNLRTLTVTSALITRQPVQSTAVIDTPTGRVGYISYTTFSPFSSEEQIVDAISDLSGQGVNDLILDLRYNGGGLLAVAGQLGYMIAGNSRTSGRVFERLRFNDDANGVNPVTGSTNNAIPFYSTGQGFSVPNGTPLPSLNLPRVFILSTDNTCSASESVVNSLRGVNVEVILIGARTCGKPFGFYPTDNCGETYYTIQFQGVNDQGFGDYADGFVPANSSFGFGVRTPGCAVADDLNAPLGSPSESLLAAALQYRANGTCPAPPPASVLGEAGESARTSGTVVLGNRPETALQTPDVSVFETNRDMRGPEQ